MRVIDRFDEYMRFRHLNDNKVSNQLGLSNGVIGKSRNKGRDLSHRVIEQIEKYYTDLDIDWLITGEGNMIKPMITNNGSGIIINGNNRLTNSPIDNRHYSSDSPDVLKAQIALLDERIKEKDAQIKEKDAQIKEKDAQIKEKDAQIKQLLNILEKK